jgi:hypothetical protein
VNELMTRNYNIQEVASKSCRDCSDTIYFNPETKKFYNDPAFEVFHRCPSWSPKLVNHNGIQDQLISVETDLKMLRNAVHEIGQAVFDIQRKVNLNG